MTTDLRTQTQIELLAVLLETEPARLETLAPLGADAVYQLRQRISDNLFDSMAPMFRRISALSPLAPPGVVVKVAHAAIPPLVGGRVGGALGLDHPEKGQAVLAKLRPAYMADAAPYLDPRAVADLAPTIPAELLLDVARELLHRKAFALAGMFLEFTTPEQIDVLVAGVSDNAGLLHAAARVHPSDKLSAIVRRIPEVRMREVLSAASGSRDLHAVAGSVLSRIDDDLAQKYRTEFENVNEKERSR